MTMSKEQIAAKVQEVMALRRARAAQGAKLLMSSNVSNDSNNFAPSGADVRVLNEPSFDTNRVAPSFATQDDDATNERPTSHLGERVSGSEDDAAREVIADPNAIQHEDIYHLRVDFFDNGEGCTGTRYKVNVHFNLDRGDEFSAITCAFASRQRDFLHNVPGDSRAFYEKVDSIARGMAKAEGMAWEIKPVAGKFRQQQKKYGPKVPRPMLPGCAAILACEEGKLPTLMLWLEGFHVVLALSQPAKGRDKCPSLQVFAEYVSPREQEDIDNGGREEIGTQGLRSMVRKSK